MVMISKQLLSGHYQLNIISTKCSLMPIRITNLCKPTAITLSSIFMVIFKVTVGQPDPFSFLPPIHLLV